MRELIRINQAYGPNGIIPVGRTDFYERFVFHEGGDLYVSGIKAKVRRARRIKLGERATALCIAELRQIAAALIAETVD